MSEHKTYTSKGYMVFSCCDSMSQTTLACSIQNVDDIVRSIYPGNTPETLAIFKKVVDDQLTNDMYHLMDGKQFLDDVLSGCLIDDDGTINRVYVDGYISNLGLVTRNLTSGDFLVDESLWRDLCSKHVVEVDWVNK